MATAGSEGFLSLLPIYLDHVLYPTLTDSAYVTEVHHINGEGDDAGVVYCEMQGRENSGDSRVTLEMLREMYPGVCGYKSETGGILRDIRTSLSNEKIRRYHREFYRPENLCVIVAGSVREEDVIGTLERFESQVILPRSPISTWKRPWQSPVPPLLHSVEKTIQFPCDDDDNGLVYIAWRGPSCVTHIQQSTIISLLFDYLNDTAAAPLQRAFVERNDPFCSGVSFCMFENSIPCMCLQFESVTKDKLDKVKDHLFATLKHIAQGSKKSKDGAGNGGRDGAGNGERDGAGNGESEDGEPEGDSVDGIEPGINMERMREVIHRKKLQILSQLESSPHSSVASAVIGDFLYGRRSEDGTHLPNLPNDPPNDLKSRLCNIPILDACGKEGESFWLDLLHKYFLRDTKCVCVIGRPSPELKEILAREEKDRVQKQAEDLGVAGLRVKQRLLDESKERNEVMPPKEMISTIPVPSTQGIHFFHISRHGNDPSLHHSPRSTLDHSTLDTHSIYSPLNDLFSKCDLDSALAKIPFRILVDDLKTNFVTFRVLLNSSEVVPPELRLYLPLFCNLLTESAINRSGHLVPYEEVVTQLAADTVSHGASVGVGGQFEQIILLSLKVEVSKYEKGINWLREILFEVEFLEERIKVVGKRMVSDLALARRKGNRVVSDLMRSLNFDDRSNGYSMGIFRQVHFLNRLLCRLETDPHDIVRDLRTLQTTLTALENVTLHVSMNVSKLLTSSPNTSLGDLFLPWTQLFLPPKVRQSVVGHSIQTRHVTPDADLVTGIRDGASTVTSSKDGPPGVIAGVGSVDSNFLQQSVRSIRSHTDPDVAPLMVLIQYLTQLEVMRRQSPE